MSNKSIQITEFDLQRLNKLLREAEHTDYRGSEYLDKLRAELDHAQIVPSQAISQEIVTMNSIVVLFDLATRKKKLTLWSFQKMQILVKAKSLSWPLSVPRC